MLLNRIACTLAYGSLRQHPTKPNNPNLYDLEIIFPMAEYPTIAKGTVIVCSMFLTLLAGIKLSDSKIGYELFYYLLFSYGPTDKG